MRLPSRDMAAGLLIGSAVFALVDVVLHLIWGCRPL